jgi:hypothetical protein
MRCRERRASAGKDEKARQKAAVGNKSPLASPLVIVSAGVT